MEANPSGYAVDLIGVISHAFKDKEITEFAQRYYDNISYEDRNAEDGEEAAADKTIQAEARQNRSDMLRRFIALVESKIKK